MAEDVDPDRGAPTWEQRWHPLREEWVLFTAHRGGRPWLGEVKAPADPDVPAYDPTCALCPGNRRLPRCDDRLNDRQELDLAR